MSKKMNLKDVEDLLPKRITLCYIDYRDSLEGQEEEIQKAIQTQDWTPLDDSIWEGCIDQEFDSIQSILKELSSDIQGEFEVSEDKADGFIENHVEELKEIIYERDDSDVLKSLIKNTGELVVFYDTGYSVDTETCFLTDAEFKAELNGVKKALGIKIKDSTWDKELTLMLAQASYGGSLVIYFTAYTDDLMNLEGRNRIVFNNPHVAIVDHWNGSGDDTDLDKCRISLPFSPDNLYLDKAVKYSYTYDVCGMVSNWCSSTDWKIIKQGGGKGKAKESPLHSLLDQEAEYNTRFKSGKCSMGDMDIHRHRDTYYINDFPCGIKCPHCGTFWID